MSERERGAPPASPGAAGLRRGLLAAVAVAAVAGCGTASSTTSGGPTTTPTAKPVSSTTSTAPTTPATTPTASTSAGGPPLAVLLHTVRTNTGVDLRIATPGGAAPARSVTTLPRDSYVWDVKHGEVLVNETSGPLVAVDIPRGTSHTIASDATGVSGAISPDGATAAYLAAPGGPGGVALRVTTIATGETRTLGTFSGGAAPDPVGWGPGGIIANLIVPFSDAPSQGLALIDPSTGAQVAKSPGVAENGPVVCGDGSHVLAADHSTGLGDDGEGSAPGAPGPPQPANTLRVVVVGAGQTVIRKVAHHQLGPFQCVGDGSLALIADNPASGGFAGISLSPDFGLLLVSSTGTVTQLDHFGTTYDGGAVYQDGTTVAADKLDSSGVTLVELAPGRGPKTLDSVPGAIGGRVDLTFVGG